MDNSQSSDIFSENSVQFRDVTTIDIQCYEALVLKIKSDLNYDITAKSLKLSDNFSSILDDCSNCILQGLDIIVYLLEDNTLSLSKLCLYLEETVCILQITSNLIKKLETMAVTCCTMKTFPTTTGKIILSVFSHCKESECIYGSNIRMFEKQLKDVFRKCHELQLTYLMTLEKHFIFNLMDTEEQDILMETLDINLRIGELVQVLDVKTMAEQWKAYTMICEKYSTFLSDRNIYIQSTKVLVDIVRNNIKTAIEANEEDKVVIRSLKVASFSLKILLRICKIFKCNSNNNYEHFVEMLQEIFLYNSNYYELANKMSSKVLNITNTQLLMPSEAIVSYLVTEENFVKYIISIEFNNSEALRLLQYILLVLAVIRATASQTNANEINFNMIKMIISILPHCQKCLNMGIKFSYNNSVKKHGLYENMLIHSLAASYSLNEQFYVELEKMLLEAVLSTDCFSAIFCSNLWVLLFRSANSQLQLNSLVGLIQIYQKLETNKLFHLSPQIVNITGTIENMFKTLQYPEKLNIYKQFSVYEEKNDDVWCVLKIRNLPENLQMSAKKVAMNKVVHISELLNKNDFCEQLTEMIKVISLASTCEFLECDSRVESFLVSAWCKICPKANNIKLERDLDTGSLMYYRFLAALASLTETYGKIADRSNIVQILHVISDTLLLGNIETSTILFKLFCKLIVSQEQMHQKEMIVQTMKYLLESDMRQYIFSVIISNEDFDNFFTQLFNKESDLREDFNNFKKYKSQIYNDSDWQQRLLLASDNSYSHKCIQSVLSVPKISGNLSNECKFDSEDFDMSFDIENDHPANKKAKFDTNIANILERLESDISKLCQVKENILNEQYKTRIRSMCEKLMNLT